MNTSEWSNIDNTYYGKDKISYMLWSNEDVLKNNLICADNFGLIAVLIKEKLEAKLKKEDNLKIYTNIGRLISSCILKYDELICFGWNRNNELVFLFNDYIVQVYSCFCEKLFVFSLDENIKNEGILLGKVCDDGIIIITEKLNIYVNYNFNCCNCIKYPNVNLTSKPNYICTVDEDKLSSDLYDKIEKNYFENKINKDINIKENKNIKKTKENKKIENEKVYKQNDNINNNENDNMSDIYSSKDSDNMSNFSNDELNNISDIHNISDSSNITLDTDSNISDRRSNDIYNKNENEKNIKKRKYINISYYDTMDKNYEKDNLNIHILIALSDGGLLLINKTKYKIYNQNHYVYINITISKSKNILACLSINGFIHIFLLKNLYNPIEQTLLDNKKNIKQMVWCGDDCLALYIPMITPSNDIHHMLFIGGPKNEWIPYQYRSTIYLIGDICGVKILSQYNFEYISRIRKCSYNIFSVGSFCSSAMLYYCYNKYKNGNICIDDEIRAFNNNLDTAINECFEACMYEFNEHNIELLLNSALFGMKFLKKIFNRKKHLLTCLYLRICINVRKAPLDIFLTGYELKYESIPKFILYIIKRKEYFLAYKICECVGINYDNVLMQWCTEKIEKSIELTNEELYNIIVEKIKDEKNVDCSYISFIAAKNLRPQLAINIIELEQNKKKQIDMLLKLANYNLSIEKAILSKNMEFVFMCIMNILNQEKVNEQGEKDLSLLKQVLNDNVKALNCFHVYCYKTKQYKLLKQFYEKNNQHTNASFVTLQLALSKTNYTQKKTWLAYSAGFLTTNKMTPHTKFVHSSIMNYIDLLNYQKELEIKYNKKSNIGIHKIQGLSLMDTIEYVISLGEFIDADHIFKKFKINETKYWMCKIHALAKYKHFDELYDFANYRTSPIGLEYFIQCAYDFNSISLAIKLIYKIKDLNTQYSLFIKYNLNEEAEKVLKQIKSQKITNTLFQKFTDVISNIR